MNDDGVTGKVEKLGLLMRTRRQDGRGHGGGGGCGQQWGSREVRVEVTAGAWKKPKYVGREDRRSGGGDGGKTSNVLTQTLVPPLD